MRVDTLALILFITSGCATVIIRVAQVEKNIIVGFLVVTFSFSSSSFGFT